jgi:hypothetical protein
MTKSILLACGLVAFAGTVCAQTPEKPAPSAPTTSATSPLVVSAGRKLDLDARDLKGVVLKLGGPKPGSVRVEWGATRQALVQAMASLSGKPADGVLRCSEQHGETLCLLDGESGWSEDLGLASMEMELPLALLFSPAGELYHYTLLASKEDLDAVRSALKKELGAPSKEQTSPKLTIWNLNHTSVVLQESPDSVQIHVVYTPIAETTQ